MDSFQDRKFKNKNHFSEWIILGSSLPQILMRQNDTAFCLKKIFFHDLNWNHLIDPSGKTVWGCIWCTTSKHQESSFHQSNVWLIKILIIMSHAICVTTEGLICDLSVAVGILWIFPEWKFHVVDIEPVTRHWNIDPGLAAEYLNKRACGLISSLNKSQNSLRISLE